MRTTNEPSVSVEDVAKHLGVAQGSVCNWIEPRGLPAHKIGHLWTFKRSQVGTWLDAGCAESDDTEGDVR